jgi:thymidylate synthase (FAD)
MTVKLQWGTDDIDKQIMFMARVSNPEGQTSENTRLLHYCMEHGHVSPFEMASACLEIDTTRDIARQALHHLRRAPEKCLTPTPACRYIAVVSKKLTRV